MPSVTSVCLVVATVCNVRLCTVAAVCLRLYMGTYIYTYILLTRSIYICTTFIQVCTTFYHHHHVDDDDDDDDDEDNDENIE